MSTICHSLDIKNKNSTTALTSEEESVKLARGNFLYLFSLEGVAVYQHCPLVLIEYLLILRVFILLPPQLEPVILPHAEHFSFVVQVHAMLETCRNLHYFLVSK